jgi:hypothetical protein
MADESFRRDVSCERGATASVPADMRRIWSEPDGERDDEIVPRRAVRPARPAPLSTLW